MRVFRGEAALALVFLALGVLWIARAARMPLWEGFAPDSGFLPLLYGVLLSALALGTLAHALAAPAAAAAGSEAVRKPLVILAALGAAVAALPFAGFALSVFVLLLFLYAVIERLPWLPAIGVSAAITGALYLIFKTWLGVPLP